MGKKDSYQRLVDEIINYCQDNDSNYAIAIEGDWGSGKTRFVSNTLKEELKRIGKRQVRISLFGMTDANELYGKIAKELICLGESEKRIKRILKGCLRQVRNTIPALGIFPNIEIDFDLVANLLINSKYVFVFDDSERRSENSDDLSLFGVINDLVESRNAKVIFITNNFSNEEKPGKFFDAEIREKLIWKSFLFEPSIEETVKDIFSDLCCDGNPLDLIRCICRAAELSNCHNVRAMLKAKLFISELKNIEVFFDERFSLKGRERAFIDVAQMTFLLCSNNAPANPGDWPNKASVEKKREYLIASELYEKYSELASVSRFYASGLSPEKKLINDEIRNYIKKRYPNSPDAEELSEILENFGNIREMSDSDIFPLIKRFSKIVKKASFSAVRILDVVNWNCRLGNYGFEGLLTEEKLKECCKKVIENNPNEGYSVLKYGDCGYCVDHGSARDIVHNLLIFAEDNFIFSIKNGDLFELSNQEKDEDEKTVEALDNLLKKDKKFLCYVPGKQIVEAFFLRILGSRKKLESFFIT